MMTKPMTIAIPHQLGLAEAKRRVDVGREQARAQLARVANEIDDRWEGDRLSFRIVALGQTITGRLDVAEQQVLVEVDLPWMLSMLANKLAPKIRQQGTLLLEKK
ncbi:polyhydroxyalkanoic acid system family protein [Aerophototrophica crusticola]